jgi:chemotaxis protein methyltransferase CheR
VQNRRAATGSETLEHYVSHVEKHYPEVEILLQALAVTYSRFFRDPLSFSFLQQSLLPTLLHSKQGSELRIWSAGCAGGQEAYSIAMLLEEAAAAGGTPSRYRIFATDISPAALTLGRQGSYYEEAVQNITLRQARDYFTKTGETFTVIPRLKQQVDFSQYDLLDASTAYPPQSIYGDFDLIFCCNLLFYYQPETRASILRKLTKALSRSGYLVTSETERGFVQDFNKLRAVTPLSTVFQVTNQ